MTTNTYAADRTALLIIDPYSDFMSEGGKFMTVERSRSLESADARKGRPGGQ
jgi:hypothetical protein